VLLSLEAKPEGLAYLETKAFRDARIVEVLEPGATTEVPAYLRRESFSGL
jgi:hypothetical protein